MEQSVSSSYPSIIFDGQGNSDRALKEAYTYALSLTQINFIDSIEPQADKKSISIEQVRDLRMKLTLKQSKIDHRIFIIKYISIMSSEAQNALLKILEELGDHITILLPVSRVDDALITIRSRSRIVKCTHLDQDVSHKQHLIDDALFEHSLNGVDSQAIDDAVRFMKYNVAERLKEFSSYTDSREQITALLNGLLIICIATMRASSSHTARHAWSKKVLFMNSIVQKSKSKAPSKLLLLAAASRL